MGEKAQGFAYFLIACCLSLSVSYAPYCDSWKWYFPWASESRLAMILGLLAGCSMLFVYRVVMQDEVPESSDAVRSTLFFEFLLPFIIFNAGFYYKQVLFFQNSGTILMYGILGTLITFVIISSGEALIFEILDFNAEYEDAPHLKDVLLMGAIFSATDAIAMLQLINQNENPLLFSLSFGEGVVNDAVAVVLCRGVSKMGDEGISATTVAELCGDVIYLFITSVLVGLAFGLLTAYLTKNISAGAAHSHPEQQVGLTLVLAFMSYYLALALDLSGITTIFFCAVVDSHYTWHNFNDLGKISSKQFSSLTAFVCELLTFILVGMQFLNPELWDDAKHNHVVVVALWTVLLICVSRCVTIYFLGAFKNWCYRSSSGYIPERDNVTMPMQHALTFGGLIRGSVAVALAYNEFYEENTTRHDDSEEVASHRLKATLLAASLLTVQLTVFLISPFNKPVLNSILQQDEDTKRKYQFTLMTNIPTDGAPNYNSYQLMQDSEPVDGGTSSSRYNYTEIDETSAESSGRYNPFSLRSFYHMGRTFREYDNRVLKPLFRNLEGDGSNEDHSLANAYSDIHNTRVPMFG